MLFPVIVGAGKRLFNGVPMTTLRLRDSTTTSTGGGILTYTTVAESAR
jgi:hypothetical protein